MKRVANHLPAPPSAFDQAPPLSPFIIRKLAGRKGLIVGSVQKGQGGRRWVTFTSPDGSPVDHPTGKFGFSLAEAKRYLERLPDAGSRASTRGLDRD
jgi:hypothetical protein